MPRSYNSFSVTPLQHLTMLNFVSFWWRGGTYWVLGLQDTSVSCFFSSLSDVRLCSDVIPASRIASWIFPRDWIVTICYSLSSPSAYTQHCSYTYSFTHMFVVVVQSLSCVQVFVTPWTAAHQASLSITNCRSLFKLMSIELVMPFNHFILCRPLLLLLSIFPSIRVFSNESVLHIKWPKYRSFSFSICPSNEYSGLISFRIDWFDLLAVQGTLKSLLQHHSSKASILQYSVFFMVQLSYPFTTIGKTRALTIWTLLAK